jgi:hypothetical protein
MTIEEEARMEVKKSTPKKPGKEKVTMPKKPVAKSGEEPKKEAKDLLHIECYRCKEFGYYSTLKECPLHPKNQAKIDEASGFANVKWQEEQEASMFLSIIEEETEQVQEYKVTNVMQQQGVQLTKVLLDNAANISIIHPALLSDIRPAKRKIRVKGVGGVQMVVDEVGTLGGFFEVYASDTTRANILSLVVVEDLYEISYVRGDTFVVHMEGRDLVFHRRDHL